jgi:predicted nucleic acid-binding protein
MNHFFDTSTLIPVFDEDHVHHEASHRAFVSAEKRTGCCGAHSFAEMFAVLTRLPGKNRLSAEQVLLLLEDVFSKLTLVSLTGEEYLLAMKEAAARGVTGGAVYDYILFCCALKAKAKTLYTWNLKDFQTFAAGQQIRVSTP